MNAEEDFQTLDPALKKESTDKDQDTQNQKSNQNQQQSLPVHGQSQSKNSPKEPSEITVQKIHNDDLDNETPLRSKTLQFSAIKELSNSQVDQSQAIDQMLIDPNSQTVDYRESNRLGRNMEGQGQKQAWNQRQTTNSKRNSREFTGQQIELNRRSREQLHNRPTIDSLFKHQSKKLNVNDFDFNEILECAEENIENSAFFASSVQVLGLLDSAISAIDERLTKKRANIKPL